MAHGGGIRTQYLRIDGLAMFARALRLLLKVEREERHDGYPKLVSFRSQVQANEGCTPRELNAFEAHTSILLKMSGLVSVEIGRRPYPAPVSGAPALAALAYPFTLENLNILSLRCEGGNITVLQVRGYYGQALCLERVPDRQLSNSLIRLHVF
jgi:hypothetical protein